MTAHVVGSPSDSTNHPVWNDDERAWGGRWRGRYEQQRLYLSKRCSAHGLPATPSTVSGSVRRAVREIDPEIAIGQSRPLDQLVDRAFRGAPLSGARLFVAFGLVALAIAVIGIYATMAYGVSRRRREMNIRVALGAQRAQMIGLIVRQGSAPILAGTLAGAVGAVAVGGIVASLLFDVRARDPLVISAIVALVGGIGFVACVVAARQGLAIDPAAA